MARDLFTIDLFRDYAPPPVVRRFDEDEVRADTLTDKMSRAVRATLEAAGRSRDELSRAISDFLGDDCSRSMLDKYASMGAEHTISAVRLAALVQTTGDARPLNALLEDLDLIVVPKRFEALIRRELYRELQLVAKAEEQAAEAQWKASK